jgi:hypothetical protein
MKKTPETLTSMDIEWAETCAGKSLTTEEALELVNDFLNWVDYTEECFMNESEKIA